MVQFALPDGKFLSTPSARRATCANRHETGSKQKISIHALREEGDAGHH